MTTKRERPEAVPALLRRINFRKVLDALHALGPSSRAQLTRATGISPPTMSILIRQLVRQKLVEKDTKPLAKAVGRPGIRFRLAHKTSYVIGVVLDTPSCSIAVSGLSGAMQSAKKIILPTPDTYDALLAVIAENIRKLVAEETGTFLGVGVTTPGLLDKTNGQIIQATNIPVLAGRAPGQDLEQALGIPVAILQENQATTIAAKIFGRATSIRDFALFDLTTGTGMGVFMDGRFLSSSHGFGAEIGHITVVPENGLQCGCGNYGCLETVANDRAFAREASKDLGREMGICELIKAVQAGTPIPQRALHQTLDYLAIGIAAAINLFNPQLIILHGRMLDLSPDIMPQLIQRIQKRALPAAFDLCQIEHSAPNKLLSAVAGIVNLVYTTSATI